MDLSDLLGAKLVGITENGDNSIELHFQRKLHAPTLHVEFEGIVSIPHGGAEMDDLDIEIQYHVRMED
jgi:hypothetical protein